MGTKNTAENQTGEGETTLDEVIEGVVNGEENTESQTGDENTDDEIVSVTIGDEEAPSSDEIDDDKAPKWVKEVRETNRALLREKRELEEKLAAATTTNQVVKPVEVGPEPTLEDCDWDTEVFKNKHKVWFDSKLKAEAEEKRQKEEKESATKAWNDTLAAYDKEKKELKVKDFDYAEDVVKSTFSVTQQGIIIQGASKRALLIYAIGKNPKKAKELAAIKDPVKFAFAVAELGMQLKTTTRKNVPAPETRVASSGGRIAGVVDSTLERLRAEGAKTGDMSKVIAYKNQQRAKAK